jgi:hypothetical protein
MVAVWKCADGYFQKVHFEMASYQSLSAFWFLEGTGLALLVAREVLNARTASTK